MTRPWKKVLLQIIFCSSETLLLVFIGCSRLVLAGKIAWSMHIRLDEATIDHHVEDRAETALGWFGRSMGSAEPGQLPSATVYVSEGLRFSGG